MFSFIWINGWVNNRKAGDLRSHRTHYDVIVMIYASHSFGGLIIRQTRNTVHLYECHCFEFSVCTVIKKLNWKQDNCGEPLQWRNDERDGVLNHQSHDYLLSRLFGRRSKKASKLRVTGLCAGNSPVTGEFLAQKASNAENASIWWRHHDMTYHAVLHKHIHQPSRNDHLLTCRTIKKIT